MKIFRFFTVVATCAALLSVASCNKEETPQQGGGDIPIGGDPRDESINGTKISESSNAAGMVKDADGNPIEGILVTDGRSFVKTDANGVYQMNANRYTRNIYITIPAEYEVPVNNSCYPEFYSTKTFYYKYYNRNDFVLKLLPEGPEEKLTFVFVGDPQCQTIEEVNRYVNETITDIKSTLAGADFVNPYAMTLGDETHDSYQTWDPMRESMKDVTVNGKRLPFFQCIGNHDHNSREESSSEAEAKYVQTFGPTDYSFDRGKVHVVVMDDIIVSQLVSNSSPNGRTWKYNAGFSDAQYNWLKEDLSNVKDPQDKILFFCAHIPFRGGGNGSGAEVDRNKNYAKMLTLFKNFKDTHIMIGHTHYPHNYIHTDYRAKSGRPIYEHIHGAACGAWWSCHSTVDGAPNGYTVYQVEGNTLKDWHVKSTGYPLNYQVKVYDGNAVYGSTYKYSWSDTSKNKGGKNNIVAKNSAKLANCYVAQIWDDDNANWKVELWKNGSKYADLRRLEEASCCNMWAVSYFFNELGKNSDSWAKYTAVHYWYCTAIDNDPSNFEAQGCEIRATRTIPDSGVTETFTCRKLTNGWHNTTSYDYNTI